MNVNPLKRIGTLIFLIILISACGEKDLADFRESLVGRYGGQATHRYYIFDPVDSSNTDAGENSDYREILVTLGDCEDCLALIYDTLNYEMDLSLVSDTIQIPKDGVFETKHQWLGSGYYRHYSAVFEDDSLRIENDMGSYTESYSYEFRGQKLSGN